MSDDTIVKPTGEFTTIAQERARLSKILICHWAASRNDSSLLFCPLCAAAVYDATLHTEWHLRCLQ